MNVLILSFGALLLMLYLFASLVCTSLKKIIELPMFFFVGNPKKNGTKALFCHSYVNVV